MVLRNIRVCVVLGIMTVTVSVFGHGTKYEILPQKTLAIKAMFDTGDPMRMAKVLIFAPDQTKPSRTTVTDSSGVFYFTPDKAGTWILQVREKGGHGMRINLEIDESMALAAVRKSVHTASYLQKTLMALAVIWGCIGTALYFKKRVES